jgi:phosphoglycolate phosphatase-like HAD superfamily hydrolase
MGGQVVSEPENFDYLQDHISGEVGERVRGIISAAEGAAEVIRHEAEQEIAARRRLAEAERQRYLDAARHEADELLRRRIQRMTELSEGLVEGAERLLGRLEGAQDMRRELDRSVTALAEAAERLANENRMVAPAPPPAPAPATAPAPAPAPAPPPVEAHEAEPEVEAEVVLEDVELAEDEPHLRPAPDPEPVEAAANGGGVQSEEAEADDVLAARLVALQMAVAGCPRGEVEEHLRSNFAVEDTTSILNDVFGTDVPRFS